jgi:Cu2+-exporting ATPase
MTALALPPPHPDHHAFADAAVAMDDPLEWARFSRAGSGAGALAESSFQLGGLHCAACAATIEAALRALPGVVDAHVNAASLRAQVRWQPARTRPSAMLAAVAAAGYQAVPDTTAGARELRHAEGRRLLWRAFVAAFCAMQVMMLATPSYVSDASELAPDLAALLNRGQWLLTLPVLCFSAGPFFAEAWRALRRRRIGMDVPVALGIGVAFVASSGAAFAPGGAFGRAVYFDSLTMFVSFLLVGRLVEMKLRHRSAEALERAVGALPRSARRRRADGGWETVSVMRLAPGDVAQVAMGEAFPADGTLIDAATDVDESLLSGESRPVTRAVGDPVIAASVNLGAPVLMRVARVGADTRYEGIVALMREAAARRPDAARLADRWAGPFLWAVLALAALAALAWHAIDPSRAVWVAVSVLIVTCPCALSLATPAALVAAAGALARRGVLLRRTEALETLAAVDTVFLDKTGTLTEARPALRDCRLLRGASGDVGRLRAAAAALAAHSRHPLSQALAQSVPAGGGAWQAVQEQPGAGLQAHDAQGLPWRLGSARWLGLATNAAEGEALRIYFGLRDQPLLCFEFDETLPAGTLAALTQLREAGLRLVLLSGDAPARVNALAARLGIAEAIGGATPERKLQALRDAQAAGHKVAMVGDGINDAPVLAQADVSFAMARGAAVARLQADAVLLGDRLTDLAQARTLALRTLRVIRQNLAWAALYNLACVPLALAGRLPPWAAGLGMACSSLVVVANALRLARTPNANVR